MSDLKLYAIELENRKVFLHVSPPIYEKYLFQECKIMFEFVKKNNPIRILNEIELEDVLKINYYVKYFMRHYGINNVRGGSYTEEVLPDYLLKLLKSEIETTFETYENDIELYENIITFYQSKQVDKDKEIDNLKKKMIEYKNKLHLLSFLSYDKFNNIIKDIEWLKYEISNRQSIYDIPVDTIEKFRKVVVTRPILSVQNDYETIRYKRIVENLKDLVKMYYELDNKILVNYSDSYLRNRLLSINETREEITAILQNPKFVLDNIFLHPYSITQWGKYIEIANKMLYKITEIAYTISNLNDEIKYDISTFPDNFENKIKYSIHYLEENL
jgi:hypothetical protein